MKQALLTLQRLAMIATVDGAACLLDAALYLAAPDNYGRLTSEPEEIFLDHWIRDAVRGRVVTTIRVKWTAREREIVREQYAETPTLEICAKLGRKLGAVYQQAQKMGLRKSPELVAREAAQSMRRPDHRGRLFQFKPGVPPMNKGLRRPGWAPGRMATTQFQKGSKSHTWQPIGTERFTKEGYLQRKVADTGNTVADYVEVHRLLWEEHYGAILPGHAVVFKDGDRGRIVIDNLELVSRAELMRRNTIHNLPKGLVEVIQLNGALKRKIGNLERKRNEEQDVRSA